jgi:hypothetical protein
MRAQISRILSQLEKNHKTIPKYGQYPPKINASLNQTDEELIKQLQNFINYLENPYYSYLTKGK